METENAVIKIEFAFVPHGTEHTDYLIGFQSALERSLSAYANKKIVAFIEDAGMPLEWSELVFRNTLAGQLPSEAYKNGRREFMKSFPSNMELREFVSDEVDNDTTYGDAEEEILDGLARKYPRRLLYAIEGTPKGLLESTRKIRSKYYEYESKVIDFILLGKYRSALELYKESVRLSSDDLVSREQRVLNQIYSLLSDRDDIGAIVVNFGSAHTGLAHQLKLTRHDVAWRFIDRDENNPYLFDPRSALERKLIYAKKEPTEVEWYRSMLATVYLDTLRIINTAKRADLIRKFTHQEIVRRAAQLGRKLADMERIKEFIGLLEFAKSKYVEDADRITFIATFFSAADFLIESKNTLSAGEPQDLTSHV